jgi:hypothetical protein
MVGMNNMKNFEKLQWKVNNFLINCLSAGINLFSY